MVVHWKSFTMHMDIEICLFNISNILRWYCWSFVCTECSFVLGNHKSFSIFAKLGQIQSYYRYTLSKWHSALHMRLRTNKKKYRHWWSFGHTKKKKFNQSNKNRHLISTENGKHPIKKSIPIHCKIIYGDRVIISKQSKLQFYYNFNTSC